MQTRTRCTARRRWRAAWPLLVAGAVGAGSNLVVTATRAPAWAQSPGRDPRPAPLADLEQAFATAARRISPSVVSITSTRKVRVPTPRTPLEEFFGGGRGPEFVPGPGTEHPHPSVLQQGLGSGIIIDEDGDILTNNHLVLNAEQIEVQLPDRRTVTARVVGTDSKTDLAIIRVSEGGLIPARLATRPRLDVGQWVLAVGTPFGLAQTVTAGIISATGREGIGVADYEDLIQTDAAINMGNSGGPLINLDGEVVGITTAILSRGGGNQGIGFAIPVTTAEHVVRSLIADGRVTRGWLGVTVQALTPDLARSFGYRHDGGVLLSDVLPGGPADRAGLRDGDIIAELDGTAVAGMSTFRNQVADAEPGSVLGVRVWRDGRLRTIHVTLGQMPGGDARPRTVPAGNTGRLGLELRDLTPELREHLGVNTETDGAVVVSVAPGSTASEAGLRSGEVITHVADAAVHSATEAQSALHAGDLAGGVRLRVTSGEASRYVLLKQEREAADATEASAR
jgi:serine protease Do